MRLFFHKITNWEYWPFGVLYIPIYFVWTYYAIRARSLFFFNAANPNIKNGGFFMESKKEIYDCIPQKYYPKTILISKEDSPGEILGKLQESKIDFPLIAKPDIGLRGSAVKKIKNTAELEEYAKQAKFDFLLQDLIPYKKEVGIFFVRHPKEKLGKISGIVSKEFLTVTGDGISTIEELIRHTPRFEFQYDSLKKEYGAKLLEVLSNGEAMNLVPFGNHCRGAKFIDASHWITPQLTAMMNDLCAQIPEFYFGRLDIMYNSFKELERGENFLIVELNGAGSEPTHIYDPGHSVWFAWREITRHITYMYNISVYNRERGFHYLDHKSGMREYRLHLQQSAKIANF